MIKATVLKALLAVSLFATFALQSAQALETVTLRIDWAALGYHAPFYYGVQQGFYKDVGLDVQIGEGKGSSSAIALVGNNSDDFTFADATTAARLIGERLPVKTVMGIFQRSTMSLFFRQSAMTSPKDLTGKRVSFCAGDGLSIYLPAYLNAIGVAKDSVKPVTVDCSVKYTAVAQNLADAVASYGTAGKPLMQAVGIQDVGKFDFADAGVVLPSHGIITSLKKIQGNPDQIRRFLAATARSWIEAQKHPQDAVAAIIAARPLLQGKDALLLATFKDSLAYLGGTPGEPFGWQSPDDWRKAEKTLVDYAGTKQVDPATLFTNDFIESAGH